MRRQNILRTLLFVVFFSIGAAAMYISVICDELVEHYHKRQLLKAGQRCIARLKSLETDYDALLQQLEEDPDFIERLGSAVFGTGQEDKDTIYPIVTPEQLDAARRALTEDSSQPLPEPMIPGWLTRCREPRRRIMLFLSGAFLILISFVWFGRAEKTSRKQIPD
jgi:hypothetical protein